MSCPRWLKEAFIRAVKCCEHCGSKENLEIHRLKRGYDGGKYIPRNCMVLCKTCHKMFHGKEPMGWK